MAEEKVKSAENQSIDNIEVPTAAEVTKTKIEEPDIPHIDIATAPTSNYYSSEATNTVQSKDGTRTVTAHQSIDKTDPSVTTVINYVEETNVGKKSTSSSKDKTIHQFRDGSYYKSTNKFTNYSDAKTTTSSQEKTGFVSTAAGNFTGYGDNQWRIYNTDTNHTDDNNNLRFKTNHYEATSRNYAQRTDAKTVMSKDGQNVKNKMTVSAHHGTSEVVQYDKAALRVTDENTETFYSGMDDKSTYYKIHDTKTGDDTYLYANNDGTVAGYKYNESTKEYQGFSDKQTRKMLQKNQKQAAKIISNLAGVKDIKTLEDYYNLLPNVASVNKELPIDAPIHRYYTENPDYQKAAKNISTSNQQRMDESIKWSPENVVATMLQQKKQNSL